MYTGSGKARVFRLPNDALKAGIDKIGLPPNYISWERISETWESMHDISLAEAVELLANEGGDVTIYFGNDRDVLFVHTAEIE